MVAFDTNDIKHVEAIVAQMVADEGAEPAKNTGRIFSAIGAAFAIAGSLGFSYDANLPTLIAAVVVVVAALLGALIPYFQANHTRGQVFSPVTVMKIISAMKVASEQGQVVLTHAQDTNVGGAS